MFTRPSDVGRLSLIDALAIGPDVWDRLVARTPVPSPFMRWAWHRAWADSAPSEELERAFVLTLRTDGGTIDGLIPLAVRRRPFRRATARALVWPIAEVGCPDHLDVVGGPDVDCDAVVERLEELEWDVMVLEHVADGAPGVARLSEALRDRGHRLRRTEVDVCPYLDLPNSWDDYLAGLSSTRRQTIRRKERALAREHVVSTTDYAPARLEEGWRLLQLLHAQRWGNAGAFADPRAERLLRRFTSELVGRDEIWLTTLDVDAEPVAVWFGFVWGETVYFYQGGRDPRWEPQSVGLVLMAAMIRRAIERGYRRFDFLRGGEPYKRSWTSTERRSDEVVAFRRGWRGSAFRGLDLVARARAGLMSRGDRGNSRTDPGPRSDGT